MAILNILYYPDSRLLNIAKPIHIFDSRLKKLVSNMAETMYSASGIGLAAPQVNIHEKIVVIDISNTQNALYVFINLEITWTSQRKHIYNEGCLSIPGIYNNIERPAEVKIRAYDLQGKRFELKADGLLATCIQHEIDHLNGKIFLEYLSPLKRSRIKVKLQKRKIKNINKSLDFKNL